MDDGDRPTILLGITSADLKCLPGATTRDFFYLFLFEPQIISLCFTRGFALGFIFYVGI